MKTKYVLSAFFLLTSVQIFAQHPLVGTWEMVSIKGTDTNGEEFFANTSTLREIKVITPTHYMLIAQGVKGDSLIFHRSLAGTVSFEGDKYAETQTVGSWDDFKTATYTFDWKVNRDKFVQSGTITLDDGKTITLDELLFQRVMSKNSYPGNPSIGTWEQLSSNYTTPDGKNESHTNATATRFEIVTPTHIMRLSHRDNKFESATASTYRMEKNRMYVTLDVASFPFDKDFKFELMDRIEGDKRYTSGVFTPAKGNKMAWNDLFQKVGPVVIK